MDDWAVTELQVGFENKVFELNENNLNMYDVI